MLTELLARADDFRWLATAHAADLRDSGDRVESAVAADPGRAFAFDHAGHATLAAANWGRASF